jgi:cytochrome c556
MRKTIGGTALGLVGMFGITLLAADKPPDDYQKAMKSLGALMQAVAKASAGQDFEAIAKSAGDMKDPFKVAETFWDLRKTSDALQWAKNGSKNVGDLETAAKLDSPEGVQYALKELQGQCAACHEKHREKAADGSFEIKY